MPPNERVTSVGNVNVTPVAAVPVQEADSPTDEANPFRGERETCAFRGPLSDGYG